MNASAIKSLTASLFGLYLLSAPPAFAAGPGPGAGMGPNPQGGPENGQMLCPPVAEAMEISEEDAASLHFMREEEKLARDTYQALAELWQAPPFAQIARSEQRHMDQVKCLLDAYGLPDSALEEPGVFNNAELQALYDELSSRGAESLNEALRVGGFIEEADIQDLLGELETVEAPAVRQLYGNLLRASTHHLRAFIAALEQQGESYTAQVLDEETLAEKIMATPTGAPPVVFDLDNLTLEVPALVLRQRGRLLNPGEEVYSLKLRLGRDGASFQVVDVQRRRQQPRLGPGEQ